MTHILRINEMAKFGRRSFNDAERQDKVEELAKQVSVIYGDVLTDVSNKIETLQLSKDGSPVGILTKQDFEKDPLFADILNFFDDTPDIVGSDSGEYADKTTSLVAVECNDEADSEQGGYTAYLLASFYYDDSENGVDWGYLEDRMMNGDLERDVYKALRNVKTNAFFGRLWNSNDLSDGDFIYIPMQVNLVGNDMEKDSETIKTEVTASLIAVYKALVAGLGSYLIANDPQGTQQK